jgi:spermidine synthase
MIVSMGLGAFAAKKVKDAFQGFVALELIIALLGCSATLFIDSAKVNIHKSSHSKQVLP